MKITFSFGRLSGFVSSVLLVSALLMAPSQAQTPPFKTGAERDEAERKGRAGDLNELWRAAEAWEDVDNEKWEELVRLAEKKDHPQAITEMGNIYYNGWFGHREDLRKARRYYERAARMGNPEALMQIGALYWLGKGGLKESDEKALEYYQKAMDAGLPAAFYKTGNLYAFQKKRETAVRYYLEGWDRGEKRVKAEMEQYSGLYSRVAASLIEAPRCSKSSSEFDQGRFNPETLISKVQEGEIQDTFYKFGQDDLFSNCFYMEWYDAHVQPGAKRLAATLDAKTAQEFDDYAIQQAIAGNLADEKWSEFDTRKSPIDPRREFFSGPGADEFDRLASKWFGESRSRSIGYFLGVPLFSPHSDGALNAYSGDDYLGLGFSRINTAVRKESTPLYWPGNTAERLRRLSDDVGGVLGYLGRVPFTAGQTDIPALHSGPFIKTQLGRDYYFGQMKNGRPHGVGYLIMPELNEVYIGSFVDGYAHGFGGFVHKENGQTDLKAGQFVAGQGLVRGIVRTDYRGERDVQRVGSFVNGRLSGMGQRQFLGGSSVLYGTIEQGVFGDDTLIAGMIGQGTSLQPYPEVEGTDSKGYWLAMSEVTTNDVVREVRTPRLMPRPGRAVIGSGGTQLQRLGIRVLDASDETRSSEPFRYYTWVYYDDSAEAIQVRQQRAVQIAERRAEAEAKRRYEEWKARSRRETEEYWKKYCAENNCSTSSQSVASNNSSSSSSFQYNNPSTSTYNDPFGGQNPWDSQYQTQQWMSDPSRYYQTRYDY